MLIYEVLGYIKRIGFQALQSCCSKLHKINKDGEVESEGSREGTNCPYTEEFLLEPWFHAKRSKIAMSFTSLLFSPSVRGIAGIFPFSSEWYMTSIVLHYPSSVSSFFFCYNTILWKMALLGLVWGLFLFVCFFFTFNKNSENWKKKWLDVGFITYIFLWYFSWVYSCKADTCSKLLSPCGIRQDVGLFTHSVPRVSFNTEWTPELTIHKMNELSNQCNQCTTALSLKPMWKETKKNQDKTYK